MKSFFRAMFICIALAAGLAAPEIASAHHGGGHWGYGYHGWRGGYHHGYWHRGWRGYGYGWGYPAGVAVVGAYPYYYGRCSYCVRRNIHNGHCIRRVYRAC